MKKIAFLVFLMNLTLASTLSVKGQKVNFNGTWQLDVNKSTLLEYTPTLLRINILVKADSLLTERVYEGGDGQQYPFTENLTLDGKEYKITIYEMPRKAKASWSDQDESLILESVTTFNGDNGTEDFTSKELWKIDMSNNIFTISFKNKASGGESEGAFVFNKVVQNL
jgi:hypothetical protein